MIGERRFYALQKEQERSEREKARAELRAACENFKALFLKEFKKCLVWMWNKIKYRNIH